MKINNNEKRLMNFKIKSRGSDKFIPFSLDFEFSYEVFYLKLRPT